MREITDIVFHCTAGPQNQTPAAIEEYWRKVMGWTYPGYHDMVSADGKVHKLLSIDKIANGVAGHNKGAIHVSWIGGVKIVKVKNLKGQVINAIGSSLDNRTPEQLLSLETLAYNYHELFPKARIRGHRDFSKDKNLDGIITPNEWEKACPSFDVAAWLIEIGLYA